jgi:hypothetical protein
MGVAKAPDPVGRRTRRAEVGIRLPINRAGFEPFRGCGIDQDVRIMGSIEGFASSIGHGTSTARLKTGAN